MLTLGKTNFKIAKISSKYLLLVFLVNWKSHSIAGIFSKTFFQVLNSCYTLLPFFDNWFYVHNIRQTLSKTLTLTKQSFVIIRKLQPLYLKSKSLLKLISVKNHVVYKPVSWVLIQISWMVSIWHKFLLKEIFKHTTVYFIWFQLQKKEP